MSATIRVYVPILMDDLRRRWPTVGAMNGIFVDPRRAELTGEALEETEWTAMRIAASLLDPAVVADPQPRVVLAADVLAPESSEELTELLRMGEVDIPDSRAVVSAHVDEQPVVDALSQFRRELPQESSGGGRVTTQSAGAQAQSILDDSDLLWYDVSEIAHLLELPD